MKEDQKIVIYQTPDGKTQIDVRLENETVWLTQAQMAELFEKDQSVVARHINNAFKEGELEKESNMHFLHNTQYKYRPTMIYSLDVVISVGYRVHSKRGTAFRIWARHLRDKFGGSTLFGNEKDDSFKSSIGQIYQTFSGNELYSSVEEKAAMLLYLVTKNHSFSDGNKRIAATLFLWFPFTEQV